MHPQSKVNQSLKIVNFVIQILWKILWQCCVFLQCHTSHNTTGDCLRNPLFPMTSVLFHGFVKTQFHPATSLGACSLFIFRFPIPTFPFCLFIELFFILNFFSLFGRVFQVSSLSKGLCSIIFFLSLQVFQTFWSYKFFTLYQI